MEPYESCPPFPCDTGFSISPLKQLVEWNEDSSSSCRPSDFGKIPLFSYTLEWPSNIDLFAWAMTMTTRKRLFIILLMISFQGTSYPSPERRQPQISNSDWHSIELLHSILGRAEEKEIHVMIIIQRLPKSATYPLEISCHWSEQSWNTCTLTSGRSRFTTPIK